MSLVVPLRALGAGVLLWAAPAVAWACPYCAGRQTNQTEFALLLGSMIALPFVIALFVVPSIRRSLPEASTPRSLDLE